MRRFTLSLACAAYMLLATSVARASIIYDVNLTVGVATAQGTITVSGTGNLGNGDFSITDYSLTLTDPDSSVTIDFAHGTPIVTSSPTVIATASTLTFDLSGSGALQFGYTIPYPNPGDPPTGFSMCIHAAFLCTNGPLPAGVQLNFRSRTFQYPIINPQQYNTFYPSGGSLVFGTNGQVIGGPPVPTPAPPVLALVLTGLGGLGGLGLTKRRPRTSSSAS